MKKLLVALVLTVMSISAQAQFYAGGTLGLDVVNVHVDDEGPSSTQTTFGVAPEFGYSFNRTWSIGAQISYSFVKNEGQTLNNFCVLPYVRAVFARAGKVDFFGEAAVGYAHQSTEGIGVSGTVAALRPGMAINFSRNFALIARSGLFQYEYWDGVSAIEFSLNKNFEVGVQFKF